MLLDRFLKHPPALGASKDVIGLLLVENAARNSDPSLGHSYVLVMAGRGDEALLRADDPAIHDFSRLMQQRRGCPGQARA
jgi:hypothetical protein